ncbi:HlyD family secretion protein [Thioclava sp. GXIMD4216]|uniref:HlyD family secretion protein n=1 Tax=Thioclava litoralis TaxID=3076557 RepID=A0ABZ1DXY7_9RHOB|nr:HlyD family secretion protein [Thioclava sp. FTW29]
MSVKRYLPSLIALAFGLIGLSIILYAWQIPPFRSSVAQTNDAYIRGRLTSIAPQLSGFITDVPVQDFQVVKKGDVLAKIDDRQYVQALNQAQANLDSAKAALANNTQDIRSAEATIESRKASQDSAQASVATTEREWQRASRLKDKSYLSQSDADDAQLALQQAKASLEEAIAARHVAEEDLKSVKMDTQTLQASVESAQAALELARINLEHTTITAPIDGRLGQIGVRGGQYVAAGTTLMSLVGTDVWVIANFKETKLQGMALGQPVRFTVDALGGKAFTGHLEGFSPATGSEFSVLSSSNATGNFTKIAQRVPVRITIDAGQDGAEKLVPGLSVVVDISRE